MKYLPISDFCVTGSGGTPSRSNLAEFYNEGTIPWIKSGELANNVVDHASEFITEKGLAGSSAKLLQPGAVLVAMYGATVGQVSRLTISAATNQAICHIYPDVQICDQHYLYQVLKGARDHLLQRRVGGGQPNISQGILRDFKVPLPPLPEQKRIAQILDVADSLRTKRRESIAQLDALVQSTFLEMFGDPKLNSMDWPVVQLSQVVRQLTGGKNVAESESQTKYKVLKVSAVTSGVYRPEESKYLPDDFVVPASYIVKQGDLLISRANTTELVGATAYVWQTPKNISLPDKIWRIEFEDSAEIEPLFMFVLSRGKHFRSMLSERASGTSGSMRNISKPKLLSVPTILPPIALQKRFVSIIRSIKNQKSYHQAHLTELNTLFASLQSRAFNGEL